jgi:hypothetical protein
MSIVKTFAEFADFTARASGRPIAFAAVVCTENSIPYRRGERTG